MNIFKIEYYWYEGEHYEHLIGKNVEREEFQKDLTDAWNWALKLPVKTRKDFKDINEYYDDVGKHYVGFICLPSIYENILYYLIKIKGYVKCYYDKDYSYVINEDRIHEKNIKTNYRRLENVSRE